MDTVNLTSEKLELLKKQHADKFASLQVLVYDTPEQAAAMTDLFKLGNDINAEIANVKKAEVAAKAAELRTERLANLEDYKNAVLLHFTAIQKPANKRTPEEVEAIKLHSDNEKSAYDNLANMILGSVPKQHVATVAKDGVPKESKGIAIRDMYIANKAAGMTNTQAEKAIVELGYSRGTTGAVCLAYRKEIGEA